MKALLFLAAAAVTGARVGRVCVSGLSGLIASAHPHNSVLPTLICEVALTNEGEVCSAPSMNTTRNKTRHVQASN